jgi:CRP-like cAMP-binding protein
MLSPQPHALQRFVARLQQRSALTQEEQAAILSLRNRPDQIAARHDIINPGETTDHACLVADGLVARFDQMRDGRRQIVAFYLPGDMCDLQSVAVQTSGWGLEAMATSTVLFIPHADICALVEANITIAMAFWRDSVADASILAKWVGNLGRRQALSRVAHLICELGTRMEIAGLGSRNQFRLKATQNQLADATGLTPVHLNRTLQALKPHGLLVRGGTARVADFAQLAAVAEFDPAYLLLAPSADATLA